MTQCVAKSAKIPAEQWGHSFSTYAKFSEKLKFLTHDMHTYVCVSGGQKC